MVEILNRHKLLVCAGSGGVGKTTMAASLALLAAQKGQRVLVLTIDPAKRLAKALGIANEEGDVHVPLENIEGSLYAAMIHPEKIFEKFVRRTAHSSEAAERLLRNPLYRQLVTTLNGSQEFTSLEKVMESLESQSYDLIVLDTPPSQHAIDFLRAPERIFNLFQDSVTKWFAGQEKSTGMFSRLLNQGTRAALAALEKATGSKFIAELGDFFSSIRSLQSEVRERSIHLHKMLSGPDTGFVLVTSLDKAKLRQAEEFRGELVREGHRLTAVFLNRSDPGWKLVETSERLKDKRWPKVVEIHQQIQSFYSIRESSYAKLKDQLGEGVLLLRIPEMKTQLTGLESLSELARVIEERYDVSAKI